jgi:ribulose-5-phosphate 4-epimerase/fuculose-1-phosphate aldolase
MFVRCRGTHDPGVAGTQAEHIRRVDLDGRGETDGVWLPGEFSIHAEIYRERPDVGAVVHGHPQASLVCGISGLGIRPIFGAYDPIAMMLVATDLSIYEQSWLISSPDRGQALAATLGSKAACVLRGHGIVTVGPTLEEATVRAIKLETIAEVNLDVARAGLHASEIPKAEMADLEAGCGYHMAEKPINQWTWDLYARALDGGIPVA